MALLPKINLIIANTDGEVANFTDITGSQAINNTGGYGSPNLSYAQIGGTRIRIGAYPTISQQNDVTSGNPLTQYTEYIKISGTDKTYDNKAIGIGDYIIPQITGLAIQTGDTFQATGYYQPNVPKTRWLPTAAMTPLYLNGEDLGLETTGVIADNILVVSYEVYGIENTSPFTTVSGVKYQVTGSGIVTYSSNRYRQGEVFIATDASSVALFSGTFGVSPYNSGVESNFQTVYNIQSDLTSIQVSNILNPRPNNREFNYKIATLYANISTMAEVAKIGLVSLEQAYNNILAIEQEIKNINNNIY